MTAYTGTVLIPGKNGDKGAQNIALGKLTFASALASGDTYTLTNILPLGGAKVVSVRVFGAELDTGATPTGKYKVGNSDDSDGYLVDKSAALGLQNSLPSQAVYFGDGILIGTTVTNRDVVLTGITNMATGATEVSLFVELVLEGI